MDILAMGEPLLELNSRDSQESQEFSLGFGGDTSNTVVAARRAGASAGYFTHIGDDDFGARLVRMWESEGVDTTYVSRESGGRTGIYFIARHDQNSSFTYYRADSPAARIGVADVPVGAIGDARLLHISGITQAISLSSCDAAFHAMQQAREQSTLVSYDPNYRAALWPLERARAIVSRSIELCDIALPNIEEGRLLTGLTHAPDVLEWFSARGPKTVVLKMGHEGALLWDQGDVQEIAPYPVEPVDSTGAGDAFNGAFLARVLQGESALMAARYAAIAGAMTTQGPGAVGPIPTSSDVLAALSTEKTNDNLRRHLS